MGKMRWSHLADLQKQDHNSQEIGIEEKVVAVCIKHESVLLWRAILGEERTVLLAICTSGSVESSPHVL